MKTNIFIAIIKSATVGLLISFALYILMSTAMSFIFLDLKYFNLSSWSEAGRACLAIVGVVSLLIAGSTVCSMTNETK